MSGNLTHRIIPVPRGEDPALRVFAMLDWNVPGHRALRVLIPACLGLAPLILGSGTPAIAQAATSGPFTLVEMSRLAATVVHAHVAATRVEPHPDYPELLTVVVSLAVDETLKGEAARTLTFRQYIWNPLERSGRGGYRKGQEAVIFLTRPSTIGLSAPVGLSRGVFEIERGADGLRSVLPAPNATRVPLEEFKNSIRHSLEP